MRNLLTFLTAIAVFALLNSCQKELSIEYGEPANGTLKSSAGDCLPKVVAGSFVAAKALNDSNFIEVTVDVLSAGPYTIFTDSLNGYYFKATGTFSSTGSTTVRLAGTGRPVSQGINNFTVFFDSSFCDIAVTVLPAGSTGGPAAFTLAGAPGGCTAFDLGGATYYKDTTLDGRHTVRVNVNVTTVGSYSINTNTVNGYFFSTSGTFGATGPTQVILNGTGKPLAAGTDNFTVTAGASTCTFPVTVTTVAPPAGSCTVSSLQGTFTAGTATTAANKVTVTHSYTTAGNVTVSTNTVNGYSFGPTSHPATIGSNSIILNATGTPTTAGTNTFTITFGDGQTCTFTVTVNAATVLNNDYFPTTQNSYWTYNDGSSITDTFKMTVNGTQTFGTTTYQKFAYSGFYTGNEYYRKDATGFYYQSFDTAGYGQYGIFFSQPRYELLFLKNTLTPNATWNSDVAVTAGGAPATIRYKYTCVEANISYTVNGKVFPDVYKISQVTQFNVGAGFQDVDGPYTLYYAKGVGLIYWDNNTTPPAVPIQSIRYWQVN